ncbi:TPA: bacteriophage Gp15 family protein [Streptococcus suis]
MFRLSQQLNDELVFNGKVYPLDLSFDNVLVIFDVLNDDSVDDLEKTYICLNRLTGLALEELLKMFSPESAFETFKSVFESCIKIENRAKEQEYDLLGNPLPEVEPDEDDEEPLYSIEHDAEYIYAAFMQVYKIDLIEVQGELHWKKFNALLAGLPDTTKMSEIMRIRAWKPTKYDSEAEKSRMKKLKKLFALPNKS